MGQYVFSIDLQAYCCFLLDSDLYLVLILKFPLWTVGHLSVCTHLPFHLVNNVISLPVWFCMIKCSCAFIAPFVDIKWYPFAPGYHKWGINKFILPPMYFLVIWIFLAVMIFTSTENIMLIFLFCLWLNNLIIIPSFNPCAHSFLLHFTWPEEDMKMRMHR